MTILLGTFSKVLVCYTRFFNLWFQNSSLKINFHQVSGTLPQGPLEKNELILNPIGIFNLISFFCYNQWNWGQNTLSQCPLWVFIFQNTPKHISSLFNLIPPKNCARPPPYNFFQKKVQKYFVIPTGALYLQMSAQTRDYEKYMFN